MVRGTYLRRRLQGWVFRRAIPQDLQARFGLREIVRSLAHVPQSRAAYEARALGFACEDVFMAARADQSLSRAELRGFADAVGASARVRLATSSNRTPDPDRQGAYEDARDVALTSIEAAIEKRPIFEHGAILDLAKLANIPQERAKAAMPLLQQAYAWSAAGYHIKLADGLRPEEPAWRSALDRVLGNDNDRLYEHAKGRFDILRRVPLVDGSPEASRVDQIEEADSCTANGPETTPVRDGSPRNDDVARSEVSDSVGEATDNAVVRHLSIDEAGSRANPALADIDPDLGDARLRFSTHFQRFVDEQTEPNGPWSASRRPELDGTKRLVQRLMGDVDLTVLTRDHASKFKRKYLCLPADHKNLWFDRERNRERTYDELIAHVAIMETTQKVKRVTGKSLNKQLGNCSAFLNYLKAHFDAAKKIENVFEGLNASVAKDVATVRLERAMVPTFALAALFTMSIWEGRKTVRRLQARGPLIIRDSLYWIPLMETCLGARREEMAQLRVRHITAKFGIMGIDLFAEDLRVKTDDASRRWIPLSQALLDSGFLQSLVLGRGQDEILFPELSNDNAHSAFGVAYGKRFQNYVKHVHVDFTDVARSNLKDVKVPKSEMDALVKQEAAKLLAEFREKMTNHGIRHWFRTVGENTEGVKTLFLDEIMGQAGEQKSEGARRYFKQAYVESLKRTIDLIQMPFDPAELRRRAEVSEADYPWILKLNHKVRPAEDD